MNLSAELPTYLAQFAHQYGYGPSVRDIAQNFDVSVSTVHRTLLRLVNEGVVMRQAGRARTWRVVPDSAWVA